MFRKHLFVSRLVVNGPSLRFGSKTKILNALASQATAASVYDLVASILFETKKVSRSFCSENYLTEEKILI